MNDEIIFGAAPRCGKTTLMEIAKETGISPEEIMKTILKNASYKNYNYSMTDIMNEAMEMERRHKLNCSNRPIDRSPEATNQRILNNIKRLKKQRGYI